MGLMPAPAVQPLRAEMVSANGIRKRSKAAVERDEAILSAALDLFLQNGVTETRIEEILEASGTSVGSFYYRYESKIELAAILYLQIIERFYTESLHELRRFPSIEGKVRGLVKFYLRWMAKHQKEAAYEFFGRTPEVIFASQPREKFARAKYYEALSELLHQHIRNHEIRLLAPEQHFALWLGPATHLVQSTLTRMGYFAIKSERDFAQILRASEDVLADAAWGALRGT
jgi:AcrR family transcriptional regulator